MRTIAESANASYTWFSVEKELLFWDTNSECNRLTDYCKLYIKVRMY